MNELGIALVGGVAGAAATLAGTMFVEACRGRRRRAQLTRALTKTLNFNIEILNDIPRGYAQDQSPRTVDTSTIDAAAMLMFELIDVDVASAVAFARSQLAHVGRAMFDHRAAVTASVPVDRRERALTNITDTLVPAARSACEKAVATLRKGRA